MNSTIGNKSPSRPSSKQEKNNCDLRSKLLTKAELSNLRSKLLAKTELKSSIPVPTRKKEPRSKSTSSCFSQPTYCLEPPVTPLECVKNNLLSSTTSPTRPPIKSNLPKRTPVRPKTATTLRSQYSDVKPKINNSPPLSSLKTQFRHPRLGKKKNTDDSVKKSSPVEPPSESEATKQSPVDKSKDEEIQEKQKQLLKIYDELKKLQPSNELGVEGEICRLLQRKALGHLEGITQENSFLAKYSPEFLTTFEKQMGEMSLAWIDLINDLIVTKMTVGKTVMSRLSLPDPSLDLHDEVVKFLSNVPAEGQPLHEKLRKIEDEQLRIMTVVMHNVVALSKEYEDLKDKHARLEKTQDQIHFQLKEEISILNEENKELDRKFKLSVEKFNIERSKVEQLGKQQISASKELTDVKKLMKLTEGKCVDVEIRTKKADSGRRSLEIALRNTELNLEKETKHHKDIFDKLSGSGEFVNKLRYDLEESRCTIASLEERIKDLQSELHSVRASLEESQQKRNELVDELTSKSKKMSELKEELDSIKSGETHKMEDITSNIIVQDLTRDIHQRNVQITDLKKKLNQMEIMLKQKTTREKMLMKQVKDLMLKNRSQSDISFKSQVQDLKYSVRDLLAEKAHLEKMLAQKTAEVDQRDLMMQEHVKVMEANDLLPRLQSRQKNIKECNEKMMAIVFEHFNYYNLNDPEGCSQNLQKSMEAMEKYYCPDPLKVEMELTFRQEKMAEMYNVLEFKQMEINKMERRIRELQGKHPDKGLPEKDRNMKKYKGLTLMFPDPGAEPI